MFNQRVHAAKIAGDYRRAGELSALYGLGRSYGCHFGMRSTRDAAIVAFNEGFDEIERAMRG